MARYKSLGKGSNAVGRAVITVSELWHDGGTKQCSWGNGHGQNVVLGGFVVCAQRLVVARQLACA